MKLQDCNSKSLKPPTVSHTVANIWLGTWKHPVRHKKTSKFLCIKHGQRKMTKSSWNHKLHACIHISVNAGMHFQNQTTSTLEHVDGTKYAWTVLTSDLTRLSWFSSPAVAVSSPAAQRVQVSVFLLGVAYNFWMSVNFYQVPKFWIPHRLGNLYTILISSMQHDERKRTLQLHVFR